MKKILAAVALTGLIATLPAIANAHDRDHHYSQRASHYRGHHDADRDRGHRNRHHGNAYQAPRVYYPAPHVSYPAPRVARVFVPAIPLPPLPHINIVWRLGH